MAFTPKTKTFMALVGLLALGTTAVSAVACAPSPEAGGTPDETIVSPANPLPPGEDWGSGDEELTPEARDRILQNIAIDLNRPVETLRIVATETATFDGCMGIYVPDQMCTMIAIFGRRVVVTDGDQSWVYHTHQEENGHGIVQNPTASGSRNGLMPDFIPQPVPEAEPEPEVEPHLFRAVQSGGLAGSVQETVLLRDGRLVRRENSTVVATHQLSDDQVAAFEQVLQDQRFPNLNRMRYVTEAAFADYPTIRLSAGYLQTEYIDLAIDDTPIALQTIVQAWETLLAEAQ
ncbi:hypothetical protein [Leptolyngbya sp. KIOST-1]|uniref:hypothetical protein n=1 Tax=Leptolyngbya sp. KIOST-1 TaxID=1229172 RepID=UPI00056CF43F|nr:hypothetical protein [Leptolyngbya sp. KIOST-1]